MKQDSASPGPGPGPAWWWRWCEQVLSQGKVGASLAPASRPATGWRAEVKEKSLKVGAEKKWCKMLLLAPNNNVAK